MKDYEDDPSWGYEPEKDFQFNWDKVILFIIALVLIVVMLSVKSNAQDLIIIKQDTNYLRFSSGELEIIKTKVTHVYVSAIWNGDSVIMSPRKSFLFLTAPQVKTREDYELWVSQFKYNRQKCHNCEYIDVRVTDLSGQYNLTFDEFGDYLFKPEHRPRYDRYDKDGLIKSSTPYTLDKKN